MRKWRERVKIEREWRNGERDISSLSRRCISIFSFSRHFSLYFLILSLSPLHFLILLPFSLSFHFLIFFPFSHSLAIFSLSPFPYCISIFSFSRHFPSLHFLIFSPISHSLAIFLSASPFTNFVLHFLSIFSSHSIFKLSFVDA